MRIESYHSLGLELKQTTIKAAHLVFKNKILSLKTIEISQEAFDVKLFYNKKIIIASFLDTPLSLLKKIRIPRTFNQDDKTAITFQLESKLLFPLDNAKFTTLTSKNEKKEKEIQAFIIKKSILEEHEKSFEERQLHLDIAAPLPICLFSLNPYIINFEGASLFVDEKGTTILFSHNQELITTRYTHLNQNMFAGRGHKFLSGCHEWIKEIAYLVCSMEDEVQVKIDSLIVLGSPFKDPELVNFLNSLAPFQLQEPNLAHLEVSYEEFMDFAPHIGAALLTLPQNKLQVNFLEERVSLKFLKSKFLLLFLISLTLSLTLLISAFFVLNQKEEKLKKSVIQFIQFKEEVLDGDKKPIDSNLDLDALIHHIESRAYKPSYPYHLLPKVASLQDLFIWLDLLNLPKTIQLEKLHYFLEKYPTKAHPSDPYLAKVELEFKEIEQTDLSMLQDVFSEDQQMIFRGKEFHISPKKEGFKVSFYLKPMRSLIK